MNWLWLKCEFSPIDVASFFLRDPFLNVTYAKLTVGLTYRTTIKWRVLHSANRDCDAIFPERTSISDTDNTYFFILTDFGLPGQPKNCLLCLRNSRTNQNLSVRFFSLRTIACHVATIGSREVIDRGYGEVIDWCVGSLLPVPLTSRAQWIIQVAAELTLLAR